MENFQRVCQNCRLLFSEQHCGRKGESLFLKKNTFNNKFLRTSGEKFSGRAVKFHSNFQEEQFARKLFVRKKINNSEIFSGFGRKFFGRFVKTAFYNFRGTFMENTFVWKTLNVQIFCAFVRASSEKFSAGLSKLHSVSPREHFVRKFLLENVFKFINVLWASVEIFRAGLWKLLSNYSEALFQGKLFQEKFIGSKCFFGLQLKNFRKFCQNCFLIFQGKILGEIFYLKKLTKTWFFSEKFSAGSSKLLSIFSKEHLWRTDLFEKNYRFTVFLLASGKNVSTGLAILHSFFPEEFFRPKLSVWKKNVSSETFSTFGKKFSAILSKSNSTFPVEHFRKKLFFEKICKFTKFLRASGEKFASSL